MLTEAMRRAGWRECPTDEVRRVWEAKGGRWQVVSDGKFVTPAPTNWNGKWETLHANSIPWRPVNPQTWDYDPRGWGEVVPTEPGLWWRDDGPEPCAVRQPVTGPLVWMWLWDTTHPGNVVKNDGHWIAPCVKPEAS